MLMSVCSMMPLHNAAMMFGLCRAHFCPLTALNQEHQLVTIFPKRGKPAFMSNLTPKANCCHTLDNTSCK